MSGRATGAAPAGPRLLALDGLRGAAALIVVFYHTLGVPRGGHLGVDLFFALSGFLISGQLFAEWRDSGALRLGRFYARRMLRLLPAFLLLYALYCLLHVLLPSDIALLNPLRLPDLLLLSNVRLLQGTFTLNYLRHMWTLSVEWQFYLVWPLLLWAMLVRRFTERQVAAVAIVLVLAIWVVRLYGYFGFRMDGLLLGSVAAVAVRSGRVRALLHSRVAERLLWTALLAFAAATATLQVGTPALEGYWLDAVAVLATTIVVAASLARLPWLDRALCFRPLVHVGRISYGLYLYHAPLDGVMFVHQFSHLQRLVGVLAVALPLADCSWRYVERPIIDIGRRLFPGKSPALRDRVATVPV